MPNIMSETARTLCENIIKIAVHGFAKTLPRDWKNKMFSAYANTRQVKKDNPSINTLAFSFTINPSYESLNTPLKLVKLISKKLMNT